MSEQDENEVVAPAVEEEDVTDANSAVRGVLKKALVVDGV
eukprot:CAMPEP_0179240334 /NCGR_PEP_ID=MMETSP0797-20121207/15921_1 /TAXON_ID=47934 /ORGANISM="Dinophysis acuminata, Strain DAEP01" /LENGTH=39 /DNA_ID= /DNA_START= /DNA_END= /DNA_ORIENTATION=